MMIQKSPIYLEEEEIQAIYFLERGKAAYVLPRYKNKPFVLIDQSETFGIIDIVFRNMQVEEQGHKTIETNTFKRKFTVYTQENSMLLQLEIKDLRRMQFEYPEVYDELFLEQAELLQEVLSRKMVVIK